MFIVMAHANSKAMLDEVFAAIQAATPAQLFAGAVHWPEHFLGYRAGDRTDLADLREGTIDLPPNTYVRLGEATEEHLYKEYCWHERIEVAGGGEFFKQKSFYCDSPPSSVRKIYTTDPTHPLLMRRTVALTWLNREYVEGHSVGLHFNDDNPVELHLENRLGQRKFCKDFCIFKSDGTVFESAGWSKYIATTS